MSQKRHGFYGVEARVRAHGLRGIDQRTAAARMANGFRDELVEALGGEDAVSPQQRTLVELAAVELLLCRHVDAWLLEQPTLLIGRGKQKRLLRMLDDRTTHARFLSELLVKLGLERRLPPPKSLAEVLGEIEARQKEEAGAKG